MCLNEGRRCQRAIQVEKLASLMLCFHLRLVRIRLIRLTRAVFRLTQESSKQQVYVPK